MKTRLMAKAKTSKNPLMDAIVGLCKLGFIFQSSEIYGGYNGFFDFGPLGVELKKNLKDAWWEDIVHRRDDIEGLDSSIIMSPKSGSFRSRRRFFGPDGRLQSVENALSS